MSAPVARRSVLSGFAVSVAGAVVGFVYGRNSDARKASAGASSEYTAPGPKGTPVARSGGTLIVQLAEIPDGGGVIKGGLVITRSGSTVHAFSSTCTHLGCTVNKVKNGKIYCPCHGSVFDATTGAVVDPPAPRPLPAVAVTVRNGGVYTG